MRLSRITVRRLHDLGAFEIDFAPGLNLILGPNGSGKSSIMRAARATLWGDPQLTQAEVVTRWDAEDGMFRAELVGASRRWQQGGADVRAPEVPDPSLASSWAIGLKDLLSAGDTESRLVERVQRQMAGGYDVGALIRAYGSTRRFGSTERGAYTKALRALRGIEARRRQLAGAEDRLATLEEEREKARKAAKRAQHLQEALALAAVRERLKAAREDLAGFPPETEHATADLPARLAEREADLDATQRELEARSLACSKAETEAAATGLAEPLDDGALQGWRERARAAKELARVVNAAQIAAAGAEASLGEARRALGPEVDPESVDALDLDAVGRWAAEGLELRAALAEAEGRVGVVERQLEGLGEVAGEAELARLRLAQVLLVRALGQGAAPGVPAWILWVALTLLLAGLAGALLLTPWLVVLSGVGAGLLLGLRVARPAVASVGADWPASVAPPPSWDPESVRVRLDAVGARLAAAEKAVHLGEDALRARTERDRLGRALEDLEARRHSLCDGLRLESSPGDLRLADLLGRLGRWRSAALLAAAGEAERRAAEGRLAEARAALGTALAHFGQEVVTDPEEAEARLDALQRRSALLREVLRRREDLLLQLESDEERIGALEARVRALFSGLGLQGLAHGAARARLGDLVARRPEWEKARSLVAQLEAQASDLGRRLAPQGALAALDAETLESQLEAAQVQASQLEGLVEEMTGISKDLEAEGRSLAHEEALHAVASTREALVEARARRLHHEAASLLLEDIRAAHAEQQAPEVFQHARRLFSRFTCGRYDLALAGVESGEAELRAVELEGGAGLGLAALSDGTRMQLLLATRVAFAASQERGRALPLFLDESLTATDPERFRAVAEAVLELVAEGRQVFYLTSDPADVQRWQQVCAGEAPKVVDLAAVRGQAAMLSLAELHLPEHQSVPAPAGLSADAYGLTLQVPRFEPRRGGDSVHLFHLLREDLGLLHRLLSELRVERLGPLRRLLALGRGGGLAQGERARLEALGRLADAFAQAWNEGRGLPVDREVLERSGAVSAAFLDRLAALADEADGDAEALMGALHGSGDERTKRFGASKRAKLEGWLREEGYLDDRPRLTPGERLARCRLSLADDLAQGRIDGETVARTVDALCAATARPDEDPLLLAESA